MSGSFSSAQTSVARLLAIMPPGAKSGSTIEVTVNGQDLDDAKELRFSNSNITANVAGTNKFKVEIGRSVPPGIYDARVVGRYGISNPRAFAVGTLAEMTLDKVPTTREAAKDIPLNSVVNARAEANAIQYFQVAAHENERVLVRCEAREIDSRLEPVLAVLDESGHEIGHNRHGGILDFTVASDGIFMIKIHDTIFRGGTEYWYRLSVGTFAHVDFAFPPVVVPGKNKVALFGRNLSGGKLRNDLIADGKPLEEIDADLDVPTDSTARRASLAGMPLMPAQTGLEWFAYRFPSTQGAANPVLFSIANAKIIPEIETNHAPETAQKISLPCEIAGRFGGRNNRDWFTFEAKKGETYWIEVVSHRLGLPTDPLVVVQRVSGNTTSDVLELNDSEANFGGAEFNTSHRDPSGKFEVKEDGTYRLLVRDLFAQVHPDARLVYHLSIRKPAPDFKLVALPQAGPPAKKEAKDIPVTSLSSRRGETVAMKVFVWRRDGFNGEIAVTVEDLPSGIAASPCRVESGKNSGLLFLTAANDTRPSRTAITVRGTTSGTDLSQVAAPATLVWGTADPANEAATARVAADNTLALTEETASVRVHAASNLIETVVGKAVKVNFLIERQKSFSGAVKLKPVGLAALDSVPELEIDAKATNLVLQIDLREKKIPVGTHVFALQGSAQGKLATDDKKKSKDAALTFYSAPVLLRVNPAPVAQTNSLPK